jgi:alcohol dehydrogenase
MANASIPASARAAVLEGPKRMALRELQIPAIGPDEALLRVEMAGVCGTDVKYWSGALAAPYPLILGHEILGSIAAIGERAAARYGVTTGDRVLVEGRVPCWSCRWCRSGDHRFCERRRGYGTRTPITEPPGLWGALAEVMYLAPGSIVHRIPRDVSAETATAAALLANGIEWLLQKGGAAIGDRIVIQGAGPQGLAATVVAAELGAREIIVTGLARDAARLELARALGAHHTIVADETDVVAEVTRLTDGQLADVVLDVTGSPLAIAASIELVRTLGTLVLAGLTGKDAVTSVKIDRLVWNEIRLQGVYVKGEAAYQKAIEFIERAGDRYPLDRIVSHRYPLEEAEAAILAAAGSAPDGFVKAAVVP